MFINWDAVITGIAAPVAVMLVNYLLDLTLAHQFVKYFSWVPIRKIMRDRPPNLAGQWEQIWEPGGSADFTDAADRHSYLEVKQFGRYLYAEYHAKRKAYYLFAKIKGPYVLGNWHNKNDELAYFGCLQLKINNSNTLEGMYLGHSSRTSIVGCDKWIWNRINAT